MTSDAPRKAAHTATLAVPPEWGVGAPIDADQFADVDAAVLMDELGALERLSAWVAARQIAIIERLTRGREAALLERLAAEEPTASAREQNLAIAEAHASIEDEVALITGAPHGLAGARRRLATGDLDRVTPIRDALAAGEMSWLRAARVLDATDLLPGELLAGIVDRLVAPHPAKSVHGKGGLLVPQKVFMARLRYQVAKHTTAEQRHENALRKRGVFSRIDPDTGTGEIVITGHAARVIGAYERVDVIARRLRQCGDTRTLAQLRSDVALDLICFGTLTPTGTLPMHTDTGAGDDAASSTDGPSFDPAVFGGALPPARMDVVVPLSVLLAASNEPGMIAHADEQEWLPARYIRDIAHAAGSVWRRLVTDPETGHMRDLQVTGYAVTGELRERIIARDRITRAPGRTTPARWSDTDHDIDYSTGGATSESNVSAKDRRGHNHKTRRVWRSEREPGINGAIIWTTPTGHTYATPHGFLYMIYIGVVFNLSSVTRMPLLKTVGIMLAGCVPLLSFWVEHKVTQQVRATYAL